MPETSNSAWHCLGCGEEMHKSLGQRAKDVVDAGVPGSVEVVHVCGACKFLHLEAADGSLRRLCEHPQPIYSAEMGLMCGRCFIIDGIISLMEPCTPETCGE